MKFLNTRLLWIGVLTQISIESCSQNSRFEQISFVSQQYQEPLRCLIYKPKEYKPNAIYPLVIFLHGSGEIGDNLSVVRERGLPKLIDEGKDFPFILIVPQLPLSMNKRWVPSFTNEFVTHASKSLPIDKDRIYLTGISIGGTGVWDYTCEFPKNVAAAIPMSGWGNIHEMCKMVKVPTWCFHGTDDKIVSPTGSRNLVASLQKCGGKAKLTEFETGGHDIWRDSYNYPGMWEWVLSQRNGKQFNEDLPKKINPTTSVYKLPKTLSGVTGIICDKSNELYGISGSNSQAIIFNFDTLGSIKNFSKIPNAANLSWQDVTRSEDDFVFIGDIGNGNFNRSAFQIYRIRLKQLGEESIISEKFEFGGLSIPINFRAMFYSNGLLYLLGESQARETLLVKVILRTDDISEAVLVGKLSKLMIGSISSAYFDLGEKKVYLLGNQKIAVSSVLDSGDSLINAKFSFKDLPNGNPKDGLNMTSSGKIIFAEPYFLGNFEGNMYLQH